MPKQNLSLAKVEDLARRALEGSGTRSLDDLEERLARGEFDLVAVGRALLQDPAWARKVHEGRTDELTDYDAASLATLS